MTVMINRIICFRSDNFMAVILMRISWNLYAGIQRSGSTVVLAFTGKDAIAIKVTT